MSTVAALVADVRLQCDVVDDVQVGDATVVGYLNDAAQALYDIFREAGFTHWFITSASFTLTGNGVGQNTSALPADFMADKGLDWNNPPNGNRPWTVPRLGTFQDRNRGNFLGAPVGPSGAVFSREYMCEGELVTVVPYFQSEGQYTLWYTKQLETLSLTPGSGLITSIPQRLVPWQLFLKTFASISVKVSRQEDTSTLQLRLDQEKRRAQLAAEERSAETIKQIQPAGMGDGCSPPGWGPFGWGDW